jgi:hypothetical protein
MFVDADDVISPDCCEYVMRDVEEARYDCVIYRFLWNKDVFPTEQPEQRKILSNDELRTIALDMVGGKLDYQKQGFSFSGPSSKVFRKKKIQQLGLTFNTSMFRSEDAIFFMEFYVNTPFILLDSHYIYDYVIHDESACRRPTDGVVKTLPAIIEAYVAFCRKYYIRENTLCSMRIGYTARYYVTDAEWRYFYRKQGVSDFSVAKEYSRFMRTPIIRKYLKQLCKDTRLSYKERFAVLLRTTSLCFPLMLFNRMRIKVGAQ